MTCSVSASSRLFGFGGFEVMNRGRHAGAAAQRVLKIGRPAVLFQEIAERLVGQFLKVLHLIAAEEIDLLPGLLKMCIRDR